VAVAAVAVLGACGAQNSYEAAEDSLREWLAAVETGDEQACDLETSAYHDELARENFAVDGDEITCQELVARMAAMPGDEAMPTSDSDIEVSTWDPSGEALAEVTRSDTDQVEDFWMVYEDGAWRVDGDER
jgi:hypothetical protein